MGILFLINDVELSIYGFLTSGAKKNQKACVDPPLIHQPVQLVIKINNMWRKSGFRVSKNLFVMRDGFVWSLHLLFILIFEMEKIK